MHYAQKEYNKAEELFSQCLETYQRVLGEKHPDTMRTMKNLGGPPITVIFLSFLQ